MCANKRGLNVFGTLEKMDPSPWIWPTLSGQLQLNLQLRNK